MELNVHKPLGSSSITAWGLCDGHSELVEPLTMIFISFFSQSSFPTLFKKAIVTPVYKKDDPENPDNYRPISITGAKTVLSSKTAKLVSCFFSSGTCSLRQEAV